MVKRKDIEGASVVSNGVQQDDGDSDSDFDMLNVDFEWFDPQPAVDFHGLKALCRQLFDVDSELFNLSELVDIILSQPLLGSTVKCDGNESDPYAFLTVLNLRAHKENETLKVLNKYLLMRASTNPALAAIWKVLSAPESEVGLILTERLINMPVEVTPPMYTMLLEEIQWAVEEKEPYTFSHYLILSKTYTEVESKLDQEDDRPSKKKRKDIGTAEAFYFHPEDELLQKHALAFGSFRYKNQGDDGASDSKRAFQEMGVVSQGHMILIEAAQFKAAVEALAQAIKPPS